MASVANVLRTRRPSDSGKSVKYTPCNKGDHTDEEELEEIEVVPQVSPQHSTITNSGGTPNGSERNFEPSEDVHDGTEMTQVAANGPKALPGLINPFQTNTDRTRLIGERLADSSGRINISSPVYDQKQSNNEVSYQKTTSRSNIFEIVSNRIENVKTNSKRLKDYSHAVYINKAHNPEPMTPKEIRRLRKKDIETKFGKRSKYERMDTSTEGSGEKDGCKWTFVFDPAGRFAYWWSAVISIAFIYNFWVIVYRFAFEEINSNNMSLWFTLDYSADFLYLLDIVFHFRTGYLEDGVLQTDSTKLRLHYMNSTMFYIDCLCLLPLDFLYLSIGFKSMLRCFRLVKIYRFWAFLDRTERHTNYPNVIRTINLLHYLIAIYHWNACVMYTVIRHLKNESWKFPKEENDVFRNYLHSLYFSTLTLTTIGDLPQPQVKGEYVFVIVQFIFGLLMFSAVLGHVANIVASISFARKDFQTKLDSVKTYMTLRRVPLRLQDRVIKWFDYLWLSKKSSDEEKTLNLLPDKLKAEIALHVHLDTLKRVEIFQNTEAGFLCELVLKLRPVLFSPGDYICTKGEVGKEMYIVSRGRLQVVADSGKIVLATLRPGSYFGEISILNMGNEGNRRTASVRSVGYSDLFVLSKKDLWDVLKDYPAARVRLEAIAVKRLEKYKKAPLENATLARCKSTPGLVESEGKTTLESMSINRHNTLPTSLTQQNSYESNAISSSSTPSSSIRSGTYESHHSIGIESTSIKDVKESSECKLNSADLTQSMTVSSITSYVTDNSAQSPKSTDITKTITEGPGVTLIAPSAFKPVEAFNNHHITESINSLKQPTSSSTYTSPNQLNPPIAYLIAPGVATPVSPITSPACYRRGFQTHPPSGTHPSNSQGCLHTRTNGMPHISSSSLTLHYGNILSPNKGIQDEVSVLEDRHQEALMGELAQLRNRLKMLEGENAAMNAKLNKQQWDVQNRLSEIEMQMCGSETSNSLNSITEDKMVRGNRESII